MYCAACDRWEYDQLAVEDCICLRCYGSLVDPDEHEDDYDSSAAIAPKGESKSFYGAQCPSYPSCSGGCGFGCTHEIEVTAVNTYPAVEALVKALRDSRDYLGGSNPLNSSGGHRNVDLREQIDSALTRFREAQAGGGA